MESIVSQLPPNLCGWSDTSHSHFDLLEVVEGQMDQIMNSNPQKEFSNIKFTHNFIIVACLNKTNGHLPKYKRTLQICHAHNT
jgi:hypothetical protein